MFPPILLALCALLCTACVLSEPADKPLPQLVIGGSPYAPYFYRDVHGDYAGIDVEIAIEACCRIGYEPVFRELSLDERFDALAAGEVDCLWCCLTMGGREDEFLWAGPYLYTQRVTVVRMGSGIDSLEDLAGKRVAVQAGSTSERVLVDGLEAEFSALAQLTVFPELGQVFAALRSGYVDAAAGMESALKQYLDDHPGEYRCLNMSFRSQAQGIAFRRGGDSTLVQKLHDALADMTTDGTTADTLALVKSTCQKYDYHHLSSTTKDLQAVINKACIFSLCTASADITREDVLLCYAGDQYLTGIIVFDGDLSVAASADTGSADRSAFLQSILVGDQVRDIIAHPQKVHAADQTDIAGRSYDYAIAARQNGPGTIVCYTDITPFFSDKYSLSLSSILDIDRQRDTVIVVTDGKHVISSNAAGLEVLPVEDCPITNAVTSDRLPDDRTLIELKNDGTIWHEMLDAITNRIIVPKDRAAFRAFCDAATAPERLRSQRFLGDVFEAMNGSWYQVLLIPQSRSRTDEVTAVMLLSRNVTAQKQKEIDYQQRLRKTAEQASLANTAKTDFLRRIATISARPSTVSAA